MTARGILGHPLTVAFIGLLFFLYYFFVHGADFLISALSSAVVCIILVVAIKKINRRKRTEQPPTLDDNANEASSVPHLDTSHRFIVEEKHFDSMDGHEFEQYCASLLLENGFSSVEVTVGSGDHGVDILAEKDSITYAIQCKRQSNNVGNSAIQEIYSGKEIYRTHIGAVMTNQYFTPAAKEAAERKGIILWNREHIERLGG